MSASRILLMTGVVTTVLALAITATTDRAAAQDVTLSAPGAPEALADRLRANSLLLRAPEEGAVRSGQDIVAAARADYGRLIGILYEEGFFAPVITIRLDGRDAARISPFRAPDQVSRVSIEVTPGEAFRLGTAQIGPIAPNTVLPPGFRTGEPASTPILREVTEATLDGWRVRGHAVAEVAEQRITARNRDAILDAAIAIDPGPVVTFGNLLPEGQERMRIERIIEIAGLPTGEVYSPEALARAEDRLRDTGVFSAAALELAEPDVMNTSDVVAILDETALRRFGFGAEISSDEGGRLSAFWLHRNLAGGAERLRFDAEVSGIGQGGDFEEGIDGSFAVRFDRPATFGPDTSLGLGFTLEYLDEPLYRIGWVDFIAELSRQLSRTLTVSGGLGLSRFQIDDGFGERSVTWLRFPTSLIYDNRDDALDARAGAYAEARLTPFFSVDGGSVGSRLTFDGRTYYGFGESDRTRLAARLQLGSMIGGTITDIPPDALFFSGGSGTVRGQAYQSLGAIQAGVRTGGRGFLGLSGEVRHDIGETDFGLVAFADGAFISAEPLGSGNSEWHAGAGLGVRYSTPFGPIRVDLATPVTGDRAGREVFLYIGIGQAF